MGITEDLVSILSAAEKAAAAVSDAAALERWRVEYLGRKAPLAQLSKALGAVPAAEKPAAGKALNDARAKLENIYNELMAKTAGDKPSAAGLDYTLPGVPANIGALHPITKTYYEITAFFAALGFGVYHGPEVEDDYHNFEALNFPPDHPSRDAQDTLFLNDKWLLRTHTSPSQIRVMTEHQPPIRVLVPGRCYRADAPDASHMPGFTQVEGLVVDRGITLADLKGTLAAFVRYIFGSQTKMRFVPHFFPFTEPSAEVHMSCTVCGGDGCSTCRGTGWLEIAGSGMVHPNVFRNVGYDPETWTGYAFGMGVERVAMLKYGINDIRLFYENDLRFLRQFR